MFFSADITRIRKQFANDWQGGRSPRIEDYLTVAPTLERSILLLELLCVEFAIRKQSDAPFETEEYLSRFPEDRETVAKAIELAKAPPAIESTFGAARSFGESTQDMPGPNNEAVIAPPSASRYRKLDKLGEGAFGAVWLGTQYGLSESDQAYADPDSPSSGPRETDPRANWAPRNWPLDPSRRGFRLPSEAEREIASRGGVRTSYGFGSDVELLDRYGWFTGNSGGRMHSPLELRPGYRGLFDMHGNAFEWVHDWDGDYGGSRAADPLGATGGSHRVNRGGSWSVDAAFCRTAFRNWNLPTSRSDGVGFRLALSPVGVPAESGQDKKK